MKDQSNRDLDELIQEVMERDAKRIPLRINRQTVVLVAERNFNAEYRKKKALQFGETMDDQRSAEQSNRQRIDVDMDRLMQMHKAGFPATEIAKKLGVSKATVYNRLKGAGL